MAKLNYDRDVKTLVNKLQTQFEASRNMKLRVRSAGDKWIVVQHNDKVEELLIEGTLRECYSFLLGMAEFLI